MKTDTSNFAGHTPSCACLEEVARYRDTDRTRIIMCFTETVELPKTASDDEINAHEQKRASLFQCAPDLLRERNELRAALEQLVDDCETVGFVAPTSTAREVLARCGK